MAYKDILVEKRGRIVCMTLNRPERMNSISVETGNEMLEVLTEYRDNPEQWVMIIAAAGQKSFCSGMYVTEAADKTAASGRTEGYTIFKPWTDMMQSINKPFICAVNGYCIGGGTALAVGCDIRIAADDALRSWPSLTRPSTTFLRANKDVDARLKVGHDLDWMRARLQPPAYRGGDARNAAYRTRRSR